MIPGVLCAFKTRSLRLHYFKQSKCGCASVPLFFDAKIRSYTDDTETSVHTELCSSERAVALQSQRTCPSVRICTGVCWAGGPFCLRGYFRDR